MISETIVLASITKGFLTGSFCFVKCIVESEELMIIVGSTLLGEALASVKNRALEKSSYESAPLLRSRTSSLSLNLLEDPLNGSNSKI